MRASSSQGQKRTAPMTPRHGGQGTYRRGESVDPGLWDLKTGLAKTRETGLLAGILHMKRNQSVSGRCQRNGLIRSWMASGPQEPGA